MWTVCANLWRARSDLGHLWNTLVFNRAKGPTEKPVFTFDKKEDAEEYLEQAKLKRWHGRRRYKLASKLFGYVFCSVQRYRPPAPPPHNPPITWK
jgi:hypothetical protein